MFDQQPSRPASVKAHTRGADKRSMMMFCDVNTLLACTIEDTHAAVQ